jgi:predicted nucleic acid-binding protein
MRFIDTNIPLYAVGALPEEQDKQRTAAQLLRSNDLVLSVQVLGEFYVQSTRTSRKGFLTHAEAVEFIRLLQRFRIQPLTLSVINTALRYCELFSLSYWDSAILAAAKESGCVMVYSEDMSNEQDYDGLRVINPFATSESLE